MTIRVKSLLWFLLPSILIATVTAIFCYFYTYKTVKKNIFDQLEIAADELEKHVNVFLEGKRGRIIDFSSDGFVRDCTEEIILRKEMVQYYTDRLNKDLTLTQIERFYIDNKKNTKIIHFELTNVTSIWQQRLSCSVNSSRCRRLIESLTRRDDI